MTRECGSACKPQDQQDGSRPARLRKLGKGAKPLQLQAHIKKTFGIEMSTDHISTYKGDIARKKAKAKAARKAESAQPTIAKPAVHKAKPTVKGADSVLLDDVLTTKGLLDRVGADRLRMLINGLAE